MKIKIKFNLFILFILWASQTFGKEDLIQQINKINEVLNVVKKINDSDLLIVFDIDDTLVKKAPGFSVGTKTYWKYIKKKFNELSPNGLSIPSNAKCKLKLNDIIIAITSLPIIPTEERIKSIFDFIHSHNISTMALTGRFFVDQATAELTYRQLASIGIQIDRYPILSKNGNFPYFKNILFSNGNVDKGAVLMAFLHHNFDRLPKNLIVIDDNYFVLDAIKKKIQHLPISFWGLHYPSNQAPPEKCDILIANLQLLHLILWNQSLQDSDVEELIKKGFCQECCVSE